VISVDEALAKILALAPAPQPEEVALAEAWDRVLLKPAVSRMTQPPFDASAMDGYAIRNADIGETLTVVGEAAAGHPYPGTASPGTTVRIFTGAPVPLGFDRVVMQENVVRNKDGITVADPSGGNNIRPAGDDFREGTTLSAGRRLRAADIGLLAAMNVPTVTLAKRPRVAILAGGDELVPPGATPGPGQIISSNDLAIAGLVRQVGGDPVILPIARDTEESIRQALQGAQDADLLVTIGGASVGDHDLIGKEAAGLGLHQAFYKVAMRPGKPLMAGMLAETPMIGLPGNPVSAMVCGIIFMQPLIMRMQGLRHRPGLFHARLAVDLPTEGPRQHYLRATIENGDGLPVIRPFSSQDSARLSLMADADALLVRKPGEAARKAGDIVEFLPLRG
jgi:molybdopterin molybdotransferase